MRGNLVFGLKMGLQGRHIKPRDRVWALLLPAVGFLLFFYAYPVARLLTLSIFDPDFTLRHYQIALTTPTYIAVLGTTLDISLRSPKANVQSCSQDRYVCRCGQGNLVMP